MAVSAAGPSNIIDQTQAALLLYFPDVKQPHGTGSEAQYYIALAIAAREGNTMQRQKMFTDGEVLPQT
jgi:hypothetical protein